jgi:hypothetical protein
MILVFAGASDSVIALSAAFGMWGGWGLAGMITFLDRSGYPDMLEPSSNGAPRRCRPFIVLFVHPHAHYTVDSDVAKTYPVNMPPAGNRI